MIETKFTPGPLTVIPSMPIGGVTEEMFDVMAGSVSVACCLTKANAHLIAAAPTLFAALLSVCPDCEEGIPLKQVGRGMRAVHEGIAGRWPCRLNEAQRAAIAEAKDGAA